MGADVATHPDSNTAFTIVSKAYGVEPGRTISNCGDPQPHPRRQGELRRPHSTDAVCLAPHPTSYQYVLHSKTKTGNRTLAMGRQRIVGVSVKVASFGLWLEGAGSGGATVTVLAIASSRGGSYEESAVGPLPLPVRAELCSAPPHRNCLKPASQRPSSG